MAFHFISLLLHVLLSLYSICIIASQKLPIEMSEDVLELVRKDHKRNDPRDKRDMKVKEEKRARAMALLKQREEEEEAANTPRVVPKYAGGFIPSVSLDKDLRTPAGARAKKNASAANLPKKWSNKIQREESEDEEDEEDEDDDEGEEEDEDEEDDTAADDNDDDDDGSDNGSGSKKQVGFAPASGNTTKKASSSSSLGPSKKELAELTTKVNELEQKAGMGSAKEKHAARKELKALGSKLEAMGLGAKSGGAAGGGDDDDDAVGGGVGADGRRVRSQSWHHNTADDEEASKIKSRAHMSSRTKTSESATTDVVGTIDLHGFDIDEAYFHLPPGKRSAPAPIVSAFQYFSKDCGIKGKAAQEAAWKKLPEDRKEYYMKRSKIDKVRFEVQTKEFRALKAKEESQHQASLEADKGRSRRKNTSQADSDSDADDTTNKKGGKPRRGSASSRGSATSVTRRTHVEDEEQGAIDAKAFLA